MNETEREKLIQNVIASFQMDSIVLPEKIIEEVKNTLTQKPNILIKEKGN